MKTPAVLTPRFCRALSDTNSAIRVLRELGAKVIKADVSPARHGLLPEIVIDAPITLFPLTFDYVHVTRKVGGATR